MTPEDFQQDMRFAARYQWASASNYPEDVQVYLAADEDTFDDDLLEEAAAANGGMQPGTGGFGMSEILRDMLSKDPKQIPTGDLKKLQENLKTEGYLPTNYTPTGAWDPAANSAFRRFDRDVEQSVQAGRHPLAAPVVTGLRVLSYALPSRVLQGVIGAAKGLFEQSKETLPRTNIGSGPLGLAGAAIDFLRDDKGEADTSFVDRLMDAFDSGEDWRDPNTDKSKMVLEDVGYFLSLLSMVSGAGMAVKGTTAAVKTAGGLKNVLTKSLTATPPSQAAQPGIISRIIGAGTKKVSMSAGEKFLDVAKTHGLIAQQSRPLLQTVNAGYRGLASGTMGVRLAGGLGSGDSDTAIEKELREAPRPGGDWLDNTAGWFVYSDKFLPLPGGGIGKAFSNLMGDVSMKPFVHVAQEFGDSLGAAREKVLHTLGTDDLDRASTVLWLKLDYGTKRKAGELLDELGYVGDEVAFEKAWQDALYDVKSTLKKDIEEGRTDSLHDLMRYSDHDPTNTANGPMAFAGFLEEIEGIGSPLARMAGYKRAHKIIGDLQGRYDAEQLGVEVLDGLEGVADVNKAFRDIPIDFDVRRARREAARLRDEAKALQKKAKAADPADAEDLMNQAAAKKAEADEVKKSITTKRKKRDHAFRFNVVRKYDPQGGAPGYATEQDLLRLADDYDRLANDVRQSWSASSQTGDWAGYVQARDQMDSFSQDLYFRGLVGEERLAKTRTADPDKGVSKLLRDKSTYHAKEVRVDDDAVQELDALGYKLVASRDDIVLFDEIDQGRKLMEFTGAGDYTRRAAFWDTVGMSPVRHTDRSLFSLRKGHEINELGSVMQENGIKMTGRQAWQRLTKSLHEGNKDAIIEVKRETAHKLLRPLMGPIEAAQYKIELRELSLDDIRNALKLDEMPGVDDVDDISQKVYDALKRGAALGGETELAHPIDAVRMLGKAMRVNGLPGFSDWMRTFQVQSPTRAGAIVGGAAGAYIGGAEENSSAFDVLRGAAVGTAAGASLGKLLKMKFPKGTYGYLPDHLHRINMALRYTLSFTFDAGRYMEQNILAVEHGLPAIMAPRHYIEKRFGEKGWREAIDLWDEVQGFPKGKGMMRVVDDIDRRAFQKGMLGFSPRYHEAAQMYLLKKMGKSNREIEEIVASIGRYGIGRAAAEKSVNFMFFPFSFQKKFVSSLGNFTLQDPGRALMIHDSLRLFHELEGDEKAAEFLEKYVPLAEQIKRLNNLAYGISPGRFVLEGSGLWGSGGEHDAKSDLGKAAFLLSSAFVPSGASTPIAQSMGGLGDALVHMFVPITVTGEEVDGLDDIINQYVPAIRDIRNFADATGRQWTTVREGGEPYWQQQQYNDEKRALKKDLEPFAIAMGYASVDGFLQSDTGVAFKAQLDQQELELAQEYPSGFKKAQEFTNSAEVNKQALAQLAQDPNRSAEEDDLLRLADMESNAELIGELGGLPTQVAYSLAQQQIRKFALERASNPQFAALYDRFFANEYGPLTQTAA